MTPSGILTSFFTDPRTLAIFALIILDVITGVIAALRLGVFDWSKLFTFYYSNVLPGVLGYGMVWLLAVFGLSDLLPLIVAEGLNTLGAGTVITSLAASINDNLQRANAKPVSSDTSDMLHTPLDDVHG